MTTENPAPAEDAPAELPPYKSALLEDVEEAMRDVVDPELGVNVVDLGLVRLAQPAAVRVAVVVQDDLLVHRLQLHALGLPAD